MLPFTPKNAPTSLIDSYLPAALPLSVRMAVTAIPFFLVAAFAASQIQRKHSAGLMDLLRSHIPATIIVGGYLVGGMLAAILGLWVIHFLILMHFTGWLIFAVSDIDKQPREVQRAITWRTPNQWIRRNLTGFWVFHGGFAVLFLGIMAFNHYVMAMEPIRVAGHDLPNVLLVFGEKNPFLYFTIFHITLSFVPKPAPKRR